MSMTIDDILEAQDLLLHGSRKPPEGLCAEISARLDRWAEATPGVRLNPMPGDAIPREK